MAGLPDPSGFAGFVELPPFERRRELYLSDHDYLQLQRLLLESPRAGDVIPGVGGLRKLRLGDPRRGKGRRGGLRVIYYFWAGGPEFWLFTVYGKDEADDLSAEQRALLQKMIKTELHARSR